MGAKRSRGFGFPFRYLTLPLCYCISEEKNFAKPRRNSSFRKMVIMKKNFDYIFYVYSKLSTMLKGRRKVYIISSLYYYYITIKSCSISLLQSENNMCEKIFPTPSTDTVFEYAKYCK